MGLQSLSQQPTSARRGRINVALTYERDDGALTASEGWSKTAGCVFQDPFVWLAQRLI